MLLAVEDCQEDPGSNHHQWVSVQGFCGIYDFGDARNDSMPDWTFLQESSEVSYPQILANPNVKRSSLNSAEWAWRVSVHAERFFWRPGGIISSGKSLHSSQRVFVWSVLGDWWGFRAFQRSGLDCCHVQRLGPKPSSTPILEWWCFLDWLVNWEDVYANPLPEESHPGVCRTPSWRR